MPYRYDELDNTEAVKRIMDLVLHWKGLSQQKLSIETERTFRDLLEHTIHNELMAAVLVGRMEEVGKLIPMQLGRRGE